MKWMLRVGRWGRQPDILAAAADDLYGVEDADDADDDDDVMMMMMMMMMVMIMMMMMMMLIMMMTVQIKQVVF